MWQRIKRIFRSIIGWFVELGEDPVLILKQNIRDLEDQVPALNENLAAVNKAHSFETMAISLSAAIQLLCARLGQHSFGASDSHIAAGQVVSKAA